MASVEKRLQELEARVAQLSADAEAKAKEYGFKARFLPDGSVEFEPPGWVNEKPFGVVLAGDNDG